MTVHVLRITSADDPMGVTDVYKSREDALTALQLHIDEINADNEVVPGDPDFLVILDEGIYDDWEYVLWETEPL